ARVARLYELVPIAVDDKTIRFVTATPYDVDAERDVSFATGRATVVTLACRSTVQSALKRFYSEAERARPEPGAAPHRENHATPAAEATTASNGSPDAAVVSLCHSLLAQAVEAHASDLVLEPVAGGELAAHMRVAGVLEMPANVPA